jgi:glycosyltransferase involved in cell wall biosynthesis
MASEIHVALLADVPQWAYDRIARGIAPWLGKRGITCSIGYCCEPFLADAIVASRKADLILLFGYAAFTKLGLFREQRDRLLVGVWDSACFEDESTRTRLQESLATVCFNKSIFARAKAADVGNAVLLAPAVGVDPDLFCPTQHDEIRSAIRFGFVGSLNRKNKRMDLILDLMKSSPRNIEFLFTDRPGTSHQQLVSDSMLVNFYRSLDCLLSVSDYEGGPLPPLEAAACGVPTIGTAVGILPEFIRHEVNGLLINGNPYELHSAVARLLHEPGLLNALKSAARESALAWRWERVSDSYRQVFQSLSGLVRSGGCAA